MYIPINPQNVGRLQAEHVIDNRERGVLDFCTSSNGSLIAALEFRTHNNDTQDLCIAVWDKDGKHISRSPSSSKWLHRGRIQFIDNSRILVSGENYKANPFTNHLKIWQVGTNCWTFLLGHEFGDTKYFQISPDNQWLAFVDGRYKFTVIKMPYLDSINLNKHAVGSDFSFGGDYDYQFKEYIYGADQLDIKFTQGITWESAPYIQFSPDSRYIRWSSGYGRETSIALLDTYTWSTKLLFGSPQGVEPILGFSHDVKRIFVRKSFNKEVGVWDLVMNQQIHEIGGWGHAEEEKQLNSEVMAMVPSPNTPLIVFGHKDGSISFWDSEKFQYLGRHQRHQEAVFRMYFNDSGTALFTSDGNTIVQWIVG